MAHKDFPSIEFQFDKSIGMYRGDKPIYNTQDMVEKFISFEGNEDNSKMEKSYIGTSNVYGLTPTHISSMIFYRLPMKGREMLFSRDIWLRWCINIEEDFGKEADYDPYHFFVLIDKGDYYWVKYIREDEDFDEDTKEFRLLTNDWQW